MAEVAALHRVALRVSELAHEIDSIAEQLQGLVRRMERGDPCNHAMAIHEKSNDLEARIARLDQQLATIDGILRPFFPQPEPEPEEPEPNGP